jgi:hypothetical protein
MLCTFHSPHNAAEHAVCSASAGVDVGSISVEGVLLAGLKQKVSGVDSEGFTAVSYKKKPTSGTPSVSIVKRSRQPLIGIIQCTYYIKKGKVCGPICLSLQS